MQFMFSLDATSHSGHLSTWTPYLRMCRMLVVWNKQDLTTNWQKPVIQKMFAKNKPI